jgi:sarcosine oxidase subunit gamma
LSFNPPSATRQITVAETSFAWLSPNEWLLCGPEAAVLTWLARIDQQGCDDALALDLSHARGALRLGGPEARDALAAVCPLDLWSESFAVDTVARSLLGETGMFIVRLADVNGSPQFRIIVDQTMLAYAARMLADPTTLPGIRS